MMSFREKRAWTTLITLIFVLILFSLHVPPTRLLAPAPDFWVLHLLLAMIATFVAIQIVVAVVLRIRSPQDARAPKDEREQLIELKSRAIAWYLLVTLSLGGIFVTIHVGANEIGLGFVVLFSFVVAEIVNHAMRIFYHRRGF